MGSFRSTTARTKIIGNCTIVHRSRIPGSIDEGTSLGSSTRCNIRNSETSARLSQRTSSASWIDSQLGRLRSGVWWCWTISAIHLRTEEMLKWLHRLTMHSNRSRQGTATSRTLSRRSLDYFAQRIRTSYLGWATLQRQRGSDENHWTQRTSAGPNSVVGNIRDHVHRIRCCWKYGHMQFQSFSAVWILSAIGRSYWWHTKLQRLGRWRSIQSVWNFLSFRIKILRTSARILHLRRWWFLASNDQSVTATRLSIVFTYVIHSCFPFIEFGTIISTFFDSNSGQTSPTSFPHQNAIPIGRAVQRSRTRCAATTCSQRCERIESRLELLLVLNGRIKGM